MKKFTAAFFIVTTFIFILLLTGCNNQIPEYTISFDSNGGSKVYDMKTNGKSVLTLPDEPEKDGFDFIGWYFDNETFYESFQFNTLLNNPMDDDFTLYAKWEPQIYRVNFYANGGLLLSGNKRQKILYGETVVPPVIEKEGYTFVGWDQDLTNINQSIAVFALYTPKEYTVTFDKQGGIGGSASTVVVYDSILPDCTPPTRENYTFGGYFTEPNGKGEKYCNSDMTCLKNWNINSNTTLYAKWYHKITFDQQGGEGGDNIAEAVIGLDMPESVVPTKKGYSFMGYYSEEEGQGVQYYDENMDSSLIWNLTQNITLYAYWIVNDYTITFDRRGGHGGCDSLLVTFDQSMPEAQAPIRSGYIFKGYHTQTNGNGQKYYDEDMESVNDWDIDSDTILYAYWVEREGTEGLLFELIYHNNASTNKYRIIGYSGTQTKVIIPVNYNGRAVTEIANNAFYRCVNITEVIIPDSVVHIGDKAFYECVSMVNVQLSNATLTIGENAFYHCAGLTEILIPDSVITIKKGAFSNCSNLERVIIGSGLTYINEKVFENCIKLKSIEIPQNIVGIGSYAFKNCLGLAQLTFNENLVLIGDNAFEQCAAISEIVLPQSLVSIGDYAFASCDNLHNIYIPENVRHIGDYAFHIRYLRSVIITSPIPYAIGINSFDNNFVEKVYIYVPDSAVNLYKNAINWSRYEDAFLSCDMIDNGFIILNDELIQYIGNEEIIVIPQSVTSISEYAFSFAQGAIVFHENTMISIIGNNSFSFYKGESIIVAEGVTEIMDNAFAQASNLKNLTLPSTLLSLGEGVFDGCNMLESITVYAEVPPAYNGDFPTNSNITIYVPEESVDDYKSHADWSQIKDNIIAIS